MEIVETQGRKSLTVGVWHKPEPSQGASNCEEFPRIEREPQPHLPPPPPPEKKGRAAA